MRMYRSAWVIVVVTALAAGPVQLAAQVKQTKDAVGKVFGKKDKDDAKASADKEETLEETYQQMKEFAVGLYNKPGSEFKELVDQQYRDLMRDHALRAYDINQSAHSEIKYVMEDRFRVFSGLYDNLLVQDLVNRIGQSVVPKNTDRLFAFKLRADPIPSAETLSTGTIYVSTGLVAMLDNKAQLAYVLAHEGAHVFREHWKTRIMLQAAADEYAKERQQNAEHVRQRAALIGGLIGAGIGGVAGRSAAAAVGGGVLGAGTGLAVGALIGPKPPLVVDWNAKEEDEADDLAFQWLKAANLSPKEIPAVYVALQNAGARDNRSTLGFLGEPQRVAERAKRAANMLAQEEKDPAFAKKQWITSDPDFDTLLAEVQRDNGVLAYEYDMLQMSRDNLSKAVKVKDKDPTALYFYAKIVQLTAKTDQERSEAQTYFRLAAENDRRNQNFGAYLHRAAAMLNPQASEADKQQAAAFFKQYLDDYRKSKIQEKETVNYPPHLETIYDYLSRLGEYNYTVAGGDARLTYAGQETEAPAPAAAPVRPVSTTAQPPKKPAAK
jgi:predicted Zn-dependent protease